MEFSAWVSGLYPCSCAQSIPRLSRLHQEFANQPGNFARFGMAVQGFFRKKGLVIQGHFKPAPIRWHQRKGFKFLSKFSQKFVRQTDGSWGVVSNHAKLDGYLAHWDPPMNLGEQF